MDTIIERPDHYCALQTIKVIGIDVILVNQYVLMKYIFITNVR